MLFLTKAIIYLLTIGTVLYLCINTCSAGIRFAQETKAQSVPQRSSASLCNGHLLVQKFEDKKTVYMLSTAHDIHFVNKPRHNQNERMLPSTIDDYNKSLGGVDQIDQLLEPYDATRKTVRWYVKVGIHFIQIAILNAYTLHRINNKKKRFLPIFKICMFKPYFWAC